MAARVAVMKLILTEDDGTVLDSTEVTREDFESAQDSSLAAIALLNELQAGKEG